MESCGSTVWRNSLSALPRVHQPVPKVRLTSTPAYQTSWTRKADMFIENTIHKDQLERSAGDWEGGSEATVRKGSLRGSPAVTVCLLVVGRSWTQSLLPRSPPSDSPSTWLLCGRGCQYLPLLREGQAQPLCPHGHHFTLLCSLNCWSADLQPCR